MTSRRYPRWTKGERIQHWTLAASFFGLAITGFALRYPESWWSLPFRIMPGTDLRGILHRIAAVVFCGLSLYHLWYLFLTRRGRGQLRDMMPGLRDLREAKQYIAHLLNAKKEPPRFGHFTYWEKMEYWALIWGSIVMIVSGALLWFENLVLQYLPLWFIDMAGVFHLYEAILASWAIVVWHYYFAIFKPSVYPLDTAMIDGTISEHRLREEHGEEWDRMLDEEAAATDTNAVS